METQKLENEKIEMSASWGPNGFEITRVMFVPAEERDYRLWLEEIQERGEC
jgi:hypothetical protein